MKIKKGTRLEVNHTRKGQFIGVADDDDFDTENTDFYPLRLVLTRVKGASVDWYPGELIPCRNSLCSIKIFKED
jgi:hypothetical protein